MTNKTCPLINPPWATFRLGGQPINKCTHWSSVNKFLSEISPDAWPSPKFRQQMHTSADLSMPLWLLQSKSRGPFRADVHPRRPRPHPRHRCPGGSVGSATCQHPEMACPPSDELQAQHVLLHTHSPHWPEFEPLLAGTEGFSGHPGLQFINIHPFPQTSFCTPTSCNVPDFARQQSPNWGT